MILSICEVILMILMTGLMGAVCALFSYFLDYTFWPGSIFKFYLPWLARVNLKKHRDWNFLEKMGDEQQVQAAEGMFWYKILGGCSVCFNIWIALISFTIICACSFIPWFYCFPYIMVSSWVIRKKVGAD